MQLYRLNVPHLVKLIAWPHDIQACSPEIPMVVTGRASNVKIPKVAWLGLLSHSSVVVSSQLSHM